MIRNPFTAVANLLRSLSQNQPFLRSQMIAQSILMGNILENLQATKKITSLHDAEFKIFSQFGDDGIIHYLVNSLNISQKKFIEFGVENYTEANTRFLLINKNWSGLIFDGSEAHIASIKRDDIYWRHNLCAVPAFITKDNINELLVHHGFEGEVGLLSVDIDGNDYWVWQAIEAVNPVVVIVEYNSIFGKDRAITVPYRPDFDRTKAHFSNMYWGASLPALCDLGEKKGYYFIGSNSAGNNAYFLRKDSVGNFKPLTADKGYVESQFRDSRNEYGELTYLSGAERYKIIQGLPVHNTRNNNIEKL